MASPDLPFLDDPVFVGRSLDSMFDLLGGALAGLADDRQLHRLPLSFADLQVLGGRRWRRRPLTPSETARALELLADVGVTPHGLARRARPVTFVDVVSGGGTFRQLLPVAAGRGVVTTLNNG
jgi:hypothetical protein